MSGNAVSTSSCVSSCSRSALEILVTEAARDLEVALETGDHEKLLVDLRTLREREEAPRL